MQLLPFMRRPLVRMPHHADQQAFVRGSNTQTLTRRVFPVSQENFQLAPYAIRCFPSCRLATKRYNLPLASKAKGLP